MQKFFSFLHRSVKAHGLAHIIEEVHETGEILIPPLSVNSRGSSAAALNSRTSSVAENIFSKKVNSVLSYG
jgi:hypothetical protein